MSSLNKIRGYCGIMSIAALLCSCSSAVFPEIIEDKDTVVEDDEDTAFSGRKSGEIELSMPEESSSLQADDKNASYEDDEEYTPTISTDAAENKKKEAKKVSEAKQENKIKNTISEEKLQQEEKNDDLSELSESKDLTFDESYIDQTEFPQENMGPSVSYRIETIYFANGSAVVDSQYNKKLKEIAKLAKSKKNAIVKVYGFASSRTRNTDIVSHKLANFKVSAERAENVAKALKRYGLKSSQIETEALSDSAPAYQEVMPEGERLNRRAEIYISY